MKLSKFISCLVPIATIGVTTPILTSCNKPGYSFAFGDDINCFNKKIKDVPFHSLKAVQNAAKFHVQQEPEGTTFDSIDDVNNKSTRTLQWMFYDLVAGFTLTQEEGVLIDVTYEEPFDGTSFTYVTIKYGDVDEPTTIDMTDVKAQNLKYSWNGSKIQIASSSSQNSNDQAICDSYIYQNCTITE